jgi:hypothetical protein
MTETIASANAAASTMFLGHNGEWWDSALILAVIFAALAGVAVGITTAGSIVSHKREAAAADVALEKFKLETEGKISESNARAKEAELAMLRLRTPRFLDAQAFKDELAGIEPLVSVKILYVEECSDCFMLAGMIDAILYDLHWPHSPASPLKRRDGELIPEWLFRLPAVIQHRANPMGITVVSKKVGEFSDKSAVAALARAIMKSVQGVQGQWSRDDTLPEGEIKVVIAPKL